MNVLVRNVKVNDPLSPLHGKILDVFVKEGAYHQFGDSLHPGGEYISLDATGAVMSPGWFDMRVYFREPGHEQKETIRSGQEAAAQGGFTGVLLMPSATPPVQTGAAVSFIKEQASGHLVDVYPTGVLTENREGKDISGMYDMKLSGARAFTDDKRTVVNAGVMLRAVQYAGNVGSLVISFLDDPGLTAKLNANESPVTTRLGFKGAPSIAEEIALQRDLSILRYTGHSVHFSGISTAEAVAVLREARKKKLPVSAEVYIYHLLLDDSCLNTFDSQFKVKPPLRSLADVEALRHAVLDGTIDVICSDHSPEDTESKDVEFDYAAPGMIGLESFYSLLQKAFDGKLSDEKLYQLLVKRPREILGLDIPRIAENSAANFTVYHPTKKYKFTADCLRSKSANSPFLGREFKGKVLACGNKGKFHLCD